MYKNFTKKILIVFIGLFVFLGYLQTISYAQVADGPIVFGQEPYITTYRNAYSIKNVIFKGKPKMINLNVGNQSSDYRSVSIKVFMKDLETGNINVIYEETKTLSPWSFTNYFLSENNCENIVVSDTGIYEISYKYEISSNLDDVDINSNLIESYGSDNYPNPCYIAIQENDDFDPGCVEYVNILTPTSQNVITKNQYYPITWDSNVDGNLVIQLYKNGQYYRNINTSILNIGSYDWFVNEQLDNGSNYSIKIYKLGESSTKDYSESFEIIDKLPGILKVNIDTGYYRIGGVTDWTNQEFVEMDAGEYVVYFDEPEGYHEIDKKYITINDNDTTILDINFERIKMGSLKINMNMGEYRIGENGIWKEGPNFEYLAPGEYTIYAKQIPGYKVVDPIQVNIVDQEHISIWIEYEIDNTNCRVILFLDQGSAEIGGNWYSAGEKFEVAPDNYQVKFEEIPGYMPFNDFSMDFFPRDTVYISMNYKTQADFYFVMPQINQTIEYTDSIDLVWTSCGIPKDEDIEIFVIYNNTSRTTKKIVKNTGNHKLKLLEILDEPELLDLFLMTQDNSVQAHRSITVKNKPAQIELNFLNSFQSNYLTEDTVKLKFEKIGSNDRINVNYEYNSKIENIVSLGGGLEYDWIIPANLANSNGKIIANVQDVFIESQEIEIDKRITDPKLEVIDFEINNDQVYKNQEIETESIVMNKSDEDFEGSLMMILEKLDNKKNGSKNSNSSDTITLDKKNGLGANQIEKLQYQNLNAGFEAGNYNLSIVYSYLNGNIVDKLYQHSMEVMDVNINNSTTNSTIIDRMTPITCVLPNISEKINNYRVFVSIQKNDDLVKFTEIEKANMNQNYMNFVYKYSFEQEGLYKIRYFVVIEPKDYVHLLNMDGLFDNKYTYYSEDYFIQVYDKNLSLLDKTNIPNIIYQNSTTIKFEAELLSDLYMDNEQVFIDFINPNNKKIRIPMKKNGDNWEINKTMLDVGNYSYSYSLADDDLNQIINLNMGQTGSFDVIPSIFVCQDTTVEYTIYPNRKNYYFFEFADSVCAIDNYLDFDVENNNFIKINLYEVDNFDIEAFQNKRLVKSFEGNYMGIDRNGFVMQKLSKNYSKGYSPIGLKYCLEVENTKSKHYSYKLDLRFLTFTSPVEDLSNPWFIQYGYNGHHNKISNKYSIDINYYGSDSPGYGNVEDKYIDYGLTVLAPEDGKIKRINFEPDGVGINVSINHSKKSDMGYFSTLSHLSNVVVSLNQKVKKGQVIGYIGSTGESNGPHLDFRLRRLSNRESVKPEPLKDKNNNYQKNLYDDDTETGLRYLDGYSANLGIGKFISKQANLSNFVAMQDPDMEYAKGINNSCYLLGEENDIDNNSEFVWYFENMPQNQEVYLYTNILSYKANADVEYHIDAKGGEISIGFNQNNILKNGNFVRAKNDKICSYWVYLGKYIFDNNSNYPISMSYSTNSEDDLVYADAIYATLSRVKPYNTIVPVQLKNEEKISSIKGFKIKNLNIYPNPASNTLKAEFDSNYPVDIEIINLTGEKIFNKKTDERFVEIDLNNFSKGFYLFKLSNNNYSIIRKFIKN